MEKSPKYCLSFLFAFGFSFFYAQPNCKAYLYEGDTLQYKACSSVENIDEKFYQFDLRFHSAYDEALKISPKFDYAWREKSVAYLKSGDFITWKKLIDKAVELNPQINLDYRAWCRYQFFRDYEGALKDFENLEKIRPNNIGHSINGDYDLYIAKAFCLDAIGQAQKAIETIEKAMQRKGYSVGLYDYYQLGVLYFKQNQYDKALENFEKQSKQNDFAENIYYKSKVSKIRNKDYLDLKKLALKSYDEGKTMKDGYTHHFNKVYRAQIEEL